MGALIIVMWVIDVLNIGRLGAYCMDVAFPFNGLAWFLVFLVAGLSTGDK